MRSLLGALLAVEALVGAGDPFTAPARPTTAVEVRAQSSYVTLRDGVRIAVDVVLPAGPPAGQRLPALLKISRFGRSASDGRVTAEDRFWVEHGFARVLIDERGTGASFGTSRYGTATVSDLGELVDWIVAQPWSNGRVGAIGVSVEGTASELLAATERPAVQAVAPWFSDYDYYTDLVRPGGVFNQWLLRNFAAFTVRMDRGEAAKRVDGDREGALLEAALAEHRGNLDIEAATRQARFADQRLAGVGRTLREISTPGVGAALRRARVPMLLLVSWFDAGTVQGAIERFRALSTPQDLYIGAWSHGAGYDADPFHAAGTPISPSPEQQRLEALRFFARLQSGTTGPPSPARRIHYYTIGESAWHETAAWPPPGLGRLAVHLDADGTLDERDRGGARTVSLITTTTGESNRWHTQLGGGAVRYDEALAAMQTLPSFTTAALAAPLEITGRPVLRLRLSCRAADPAIFAYLVAVDPQGRSFYLTEGELRLIHRRIAAAEPTLHSYRRADARPVPQGEPFDADLTLLPLSAWLAPGFRLRLLLASGDSSTFAPAQEYAAKVFSASTLILPSRTRPAVAAAAPSSAKGGSP